MFLFQSGPPVILGELVRQHETVALAHGHIRASRKKRRNQDLNGVFEESQASYMPGMPEYGSEEE